MTSKDLQKTILEAIEEGLSTLGESPKQAILFHLEKTFKLRREEIPQNLTEFQKALEKIFGPGASYLERVILKRLCDKLNIDFEKIEIEEPNINILENLKRLLPLGDA